MLAAAAALHDSERPGDRTAHSPVGVQLGTEGGTLLVSLDSRSYLPERLGVMRLPGQPVPVTANVDLLQLDSLEILEAAWRDFTAALTAVGGVKQVLPLVGTLASIAPGELTSMPGAQEFLVLRQIRDAATAGRWQRVVVDLSGVGDPYAVLRSPMVLSAALERLWPRNARLAEASEKPTVAQLSAALEGIDRDCHDLTELLTDPHGVAAHLVVDAGDRGVRAAADHLAIIDLMGIPLRSVLVNAGVGGPGSVDDATAAVVNLLHNDESVTVTAIPRAAKGLDRLSRINRIAVELPKPAGRPRGSGALTVAHVSGEGLDSIFEMTWKQGLPDPNRLELGRSGDELLVTVSGFRYPVTLPSVLRRCVVTGADWHDGTLILRFVPDASVWPQKSGKTGR